MDDVENKMPSFQERGRLSYGAGLTLDLAKKMLEAGQREAEKQGVPMVMAIADSGGNLLALNRMDNAMLCSIQIAMDKAYTAVLGKVPTSSWGEQYRGNGELVPLFFHERWIVFPGGFPILNNEVIVGGIGVSGGTIEDSYVARAALEAGGFSLDGVNQTIAQMESMRQ